MNEKISKGCKNKKRQETLDLLRKRPELRWDNHNIFHGRLKHFLPSCAPLVTWDGGQKSCSGKLSASELQDQRDVLHEKVGFLVKLLLESGHTSLYTGAGVSASAGVQQIARGSKRRLRRPHTTNAKVRAKNLEGKEYLERGRNCLWLKVASFFKEVDLRTHNSIIRS